MATKVFISWSGELSRRLAEELRSWLPAVLQSVRPYFTPEDVEKGARWGQDISDELNTSDVGLICLTPDNLNAPWILFEAGALSKSFEKSRVCPVLFGVDTADLTGPLTIFQSTKFASTEFRKLVKTINAASGEQRLEEKVLDEVIGMWWPRLEQKVTTIMSERRLDASSAERTERDILEEILELARLNSRRSPLAPAIHPRTWSELQRGIEVLRLYGEAGDNDAMKTAIDAIERPIVHIMKNYHDSSEWREHRRLIERERAQASLFADRVRKAALSKDKRDDSDEAAD